LLLSSLLPPVPLFQLMHPRQYDSNVIRYEDQEVHRSNTELTNERDVTEQQAAVLKTVGWVLPAGWAGGMRWPPPNTGCEAGKPCPPNLASDQTQ
jgi:hypothetical protein